MDDRREQMIAEEAYEMMAKNRKHRASPAEGTAGLSSPPAGRGDGGRGSKVSICMTCHAPVDWIDDRVLGTWVPKDHGTLTTHHCQTPRPQGGKGGIQ